AVCTVLGHTVFNWTLRHVRAAVVSVSFLGEPPITALLAIPLLAERPPGPALVGGVVILAGLGLALAERPAAAPAELGEIAAAGWRSFGWARTIWLGGMEPVASVCFGPMAPLRSNGNPTVTICRGPREPSGLTISASPQAAAEGPRDGGDGRTSRRPRDHPG